MLEIANSGHARGRLSPFHVKRGRDKRGSRRDHARVFDELAAAAAGIARSSTHRARQATRLALGVTAAMVIATATAAAQPPSAPAPRPRAANTACTPVYLCPYDGGAGGVGGTGGIGGAGSGGAGAGGATGGTAGQPPAGGLVVHELTLSRRVIATGQTLEAEVTANNTSSSPLTLRELRIAARAPGASHADGPYTDLAPALTMLTIPAGGHVTLAASRAFKSTDTTGRWEAYATYQDGDGWHDAPSKYFGVVAGGGGGAAGGGGGGGGGDRPTMTVGTQAWFVASWAGTNYFKPGVNWSSAYADGDDVWNPQLLAELAGGFRVWRHMDMNAVNWSRIERWSQRKLPTDPRNAEVYIDGDSPADTTGLAVEWQIDLCNRAHLDCWFTHPYLADDDYLTEQAKLIKAKLDPSRLVYIELSNEVWNGGFLAFDQAIAAGEAMGVPGDNQYYVGIGHEMVRALQMYAIYQSVFGATAMGSRVIRVFSESGNLDLTTQALRNVYDSPQWNPHGQVIDLIALAPYIGNGQNGATESLERWSAEVDDKVRGDIAYALDSHVRAYDIGKFGCYEGGMHHLQNADAWARNPAAYDGYRYMLDRFAVGGEMTGPCVLYTLDGTWDSGGAWGLYEHVGQALSDAPKARGVKDWIAGVSAATTSAVPWGLILALILLALGIAAWFWRIRVHRMQFEARLAQRIAEANRPTPDPAAPTSSRDDEPTQ